MALFFIQFALIFCYIDAAINLDPTNPTYLWQRASVYCEMNETKKAIDSFELLLKVRLGKRGVIQGCHLYSLSAAASSRSCPTADWSQQRSGYGRIMIFLCLYVHK